MSFGVTNRRQMSRAYVTKRGPDVTFRTPDVTFRGLSVTNRPLERLAELARVVPVDQIWSAKMVGDELTEAVRLCNRIAGAVLPSERTGFWPATLVEWSDLLAMVETNEKPSDDEPRRYMPTARQVSRCERAIGWQARYLPGSDHEAMRRVLALWLRSRVARHLSFSEILKAKGIARTTAYRARDKALLLIAIGLTTERVKP